MTEPPEGFRPEILAYYRQAPEGTRLQTGPFRLEFARTKEILLRELPPPPARVYDVGGGSGPYSLWLAELGYEAHLLEPVPELLRQAQAASAASPRPLANCTVGDARRLDRTDASADVVLELGPLYHLPERQGRLRALGEAFRVLRPGGLLVAAAISRFASALGGLSQDALSDPDFAAMVEEDLETGVHRNDTDRLDYFTTAYFHRPEELEAETREAGFEQVRILGVEGPGWVFHDFDRLWDDPRRREELLWVARSLESEPSIQGLSAHLLAVARKPAG